MLDAASFPPDSASATLSDSGATADDAVADGAWPLVREDWQLFRFGYNVLQNRPLHVAHVPLDREAWGALRDHFAAAYLEQQRALGELWAALLDVALLEAWRGEGEGFHARAAGLLDPEQPGAVDGVALLRRLEARLGAGFASAEIAALEAGFGAARGSRCDATPARRPGAASRSPRAAGRPRAPSGSRSGGTRGFPHAGGASGAGCLGPTPRGGDRRAAPLAPPRPGAGPAGGHRSTPGSAAVARRFAPFGSSACSPTAPRPWVRGRCARAERRSPRWRREPGSASGRSARAS